LLVINNELEIMAIINKLHDSNNVSILIL